MEVDPDEGLRKQRTKRFDVANALKENEGRKGARLYLSKVRLFGAVFAYVSVMLI